MEPIIIEELARMLEDQGAEKGREIGRREGEEIGRRNTEARARESVVDLADAYGIALDDGRRAWIAGASLTELDVVRAALKRDRAWPV